MGEKSAARERAVEPLTEEYREVIRLRVSKFMRGWRRAPGSIEAHDLCQEIELKFIQKRPFDRWEESRGSKKRLLNVFVVSRLIEIRRREDHRLQLVDIDADATPEDCAGSENPERLGASRELLRQLLAHLEANLSRGEWLLFLRMFEQGMEREELERLEGIGARKYYRVRNKIRTMAREFLRRQR